MTLANDKGTDGQRTDRVQRNWPPPREEGRIIIACSFTLFPSIRIGVLNCPLLFPFNSFLSVTDCGEIVLKCSVV